MAKRRVTLEIDEDLLLWAAELADVSAMSGSEWINHVLRTCWIGEYDDCHFDYQWCDENPTERVIARHCRENGYTHVRPKGFMRHYYNVGWKNSDGKQLRDWRSAVREWEYILSATCREDVEKLADDDPRRLMRRDGGECGNSDQGSAKGIGRVVNGGGRTAGFDSESVPDRKTVAAEGVPDFGTTGGDKSGTEENWPATFAIGRESDLT